MDKKSTKKGVSQSETTNKELEIIDPVYQKYVKGVIRTLGTTDFYDFFMSSIACAENEFQFSNRRLEKFVGRMVLYLRFGHLPCYFVLLLHIQEMVAWENV